MSQRPGGWGEDRHREREILTALNKPDEFILAIVERDGEARSVHYVSCRHETYVACISRDFCRPISP
jgi:hypothetical protein